MSKIFEASPAYLETSEMWRQVNMAIKGKLAIDAYALEGKTTTSMYGPKFTAYQCVQGTDSYGQPSAVVTQDQSEEKNMLRRYWSMARYLNATARTLESSSGFIWQNEPVVDIPEQLDYIEIREIAQQVVNQLISNGRCGCLVDTRAADGDTTYANQNMPEFVFYRPEQIIDVKYRNGKMCDVRLMEAIEVPVDEDEIEWKCVEQLRRLRLVDGVYIQEIWDKEKGTKVEVIEPIFNGQKLDYIPFQIMGADDNSVGMSKPPLFDLASENLGHYSLAADDRANTHMTCNGVWMIYTEMDPSEMAERNPIGIKVDAGARNTLKSTDRAEIIQAQPGNASVAMEKAEQRMLMLGAQLVTSNSSNQTLGAKKIESNSSLSTLSRISYNASHGITQLYNWAAQFLNIKYDCSYELNKEFLPDEMDAQQVMALMQQVQFGLMPKESLWNVNRRNNITDLSDEEIEEMIQDGNVSGGLTEEEARAQALREAAEEE